MPNTTDEDTIQDALYQTSLDWLNLYRNRSDRHERRKKANSILQLWVVRNEKERLEGNYQFPNLKSFVPKNQWRRGNIVYEPSFLRFIGALTSYIEANQGQRWR